MKKVCDNCEKEFDSDNSRRKFCCNECYCKNKSKRHYAKYGKLTVGEMDNKPVCVKCGKEFIPSDKGQKFCSHNCRKKFLDIPSCLEEVSRKLDKTIGYVRVYCPMHPKANTWGYVYEHRLIMESIIGRHLKEDEHVHHINGKRWDNRPGNLQLLSSSEHAILTAKNNNAILP